MIGFVLFLASVALAAWTSLAYIGPYRWLVEMQLAHFGTYRADAPFLAVLALFVIPSVFVGRWLNRKYPTPRLTTLIVHPLARGISMAEVWLRKLPPLSWVHPFVFGLLITGAGFAYQWYLNAFGPAQPQPLDMTNVVEGRSLPEGYVELRHAIVLQQPTFVYVEKGRLLTKKTKFRLAAPNGQAAARHIVIVIATSMIDEEQESAVPTRLVGYLARGGLPGPTEERAKLFLASKYYVLTVGKTGNGSNTIFEMFLLGGLLLLTGVIWFGKAQFSKLRRQ